MLTRKFAVFLLIGCIVPLAGCQFFFGRNKEEIQAIEAVKQRVLANPGTVGEDDGEGTPLNYAILNNYLDLAEWLVLHGANVEAEDRNHENALRVAIRSDRTKDLSMLKFVLSHGGQVNTFGPSQQMPLHDAAAAGKEKVALLLIEHGARVAGRSFTGAMPLHVACEHPGNQAVAKVLLDHGAKIEAHTFADDTPLCRAAVTGHPDMAQFLLENGAEPSGACFRGTTPLHFAALRGDAETAKILIDHGANISARDYKGNTPMMVARRAQQNGQNGNAGIPSNQNAVFDLLQQRGATE